jgi:4-hydroxy-2-oxoheptanedioate aldolase
MSEHAVPAKQVILGIWQHLPIPMVSRYLAQMGWDWIILDLQHGPMNSETAYECIHTIRTAGSKPLVRVPIGNPSDIQKYLDLGAQGIVVPMINSREEAEISAQAAKYPPTGGRSMGGDDRVHYGEDYPQRANRETKLLVQIEHIDAVNVVEAILSVEGVDGCFVGPTDLALSMGLPHAGFESNPQHRAAIQRTLEACQAAGKMPCCNTYSLPEAQAKAKQGYQCITLESDMKLFITAAQRLLADLRAEIEGI